MASVIKGVLLKVDPAICMFIQKLDRKENVIVKYLDERHLFVKKEKVQYIQEKIDEMLDANNYDRIK